MNHLTKITLVTICITLLSSLKVTTAQTPFNGVSVQEVTIPAGPLADH